MPTEPIRQTFINIPTWAELTLYFTSVISVAIMVLGFVRRARPWAIDRKQFSKQFVIDILPNGAAKVLANVFGQQRLLRKPYGGTMHFGLFWGFVLLFIGTALATIDWDITKKIFDVQFLVGAFYLGYEFVLDIAGIAFIAALGMALYRRYVQRPPQLTYLRDFPITLWALLAISVTGYFIEGLRIAGVRPFIHEGARAAAAFVPPWGMWSPVGYALAQVLAVLPVDARENLHFALWLFHATVALVWIASISWNENAEHILTAPLNTFFAPLKSPPPTLTPINIEEAMEKGLPLGVSKLEEFRWQQRMAFDTCTMCGRCEAACPAFLQQTPLSPKRVILKLRDHQHAMARLAPDAERPALTGAEGGVVTADELFSCTTCMACVRECPVFIPIVDTIVDLRRFLALSEGAIPAAGQGALRNVERAGNPWGQSQSERAKWADGLGVKAMAEAQDAEVLYWVGCAGSYDARNQKIARAVVKVLQTANVSFAILGKEEKCVGDWQRRMGEEYQFQTLAAENIETMKGYKFKTVIAHCPHCFNTLKNDYPQFGGNYEVMHHSQFIAKLIGDGRLKLSKPLADPAVTFHDSCYLGRYNGEFDAPRNVIGAIPGVQLREMERSRSTGLCCGGGGGQMWMEPLTPKGAKKVNAHRLDEAQATGAKTIGTACSYCTIMMEDAVATKGVQEQVRVRDIAELTVEAM